MPTPLELLDEARALGLDVEEERVDLTVLRSNLAVLRVLAPEMQGYGIDVLNQGQPLTVGAVAVVPASAASMLDRVEARLDTVEARLAEVANVEDKLAELAEREIQKRVD